VNGRSADAIVPLRVTGAEGGEGVSHDMVIRGGFVVDGTRSVGRTADVAIDDGIVTAVGQIGGRGIRELDADGLLVTPGFVDVHSHYDGQATWDPVLAPSAWHGVTTTVMGNCGVGFAPVAPDRHEWLIGLMEGVEDIPGAALSVGIDWQWETFPDFLDHLATKQWTMDVGTQVPHGAVRAYVMGERGARNQPATPADIEAMAAIVAEGLDAGALGFSTSRTLAHRAVDGEPVPRNLRRQRRAVRDRTGAGRGRFRGVRAGGSGRPGRGRGRPTEGDGVDASSGRRDRPAGAVRLDPKQLGARPMGRDARAPG
jgi:N-acyl-D-aspartate/D-glutamate deacylase